MLVSSVVTFELWCGVAKSQRKEANTQRLLAFLAGPLEWTLFDEEDAREAGAVRAELEIAGRPIGAYRRVDLRPSATPRRDARHGEGRRV